MENTGKMSWPEIQAKLFTLEGSPTLNWSATESFVASLNYDDKWYNEFGHA